MEDLNVLSQHFPVVARIGSGFFHVIKILFDVLQSEIIVCWFASVYSAIAVIFGHWLGVKTVIIIGGADVSADKEIGYGLWLSKWKSWLVKRALRKADSVLTVDQSLKDEAKQRAKYKGENISYLPTGYDALYWKSAGEKKPIVLTVAYANDSTRFKVKGIDFLIQAAQRMPLVEFIVVGVQPDFAYKYSPPLNMKFHPRIRHEDVLRYYQEAKVYCQPSRKEGLCNALCEAMLCECYPVATDVGGNPTAVGDSGILLPYGDVDALVESITYALESKDDSPHKARARIVSLFPKEKREQELVKLMNRLAQ